MTDENQKIWRDAGLLGIVIAFFAVLVASLMTAYSPLDIWQFVGELLATLISVYFALIIGLMIYQRESRDVGKRKEKEDDEATYRAVEGVAGELQSILVRLNVEESPSTNATVFQPREPRIFTVTDPDNRKKQKEVVVHPVEPTLIVEASRSRLFQQIDTAFWIELTTRIRSYDSACSLFLTQYLQPFGQITRRQKRELWITAEYVEARRIEAISEIKGIQRVVGEWQRENAHARPSE